MKFAKHRLGKLTEEEKRILALEGIIQKVASLFPFLALVAIFYLIKSLGGEAQHFSTATRAAFAVLIALAACGCGLAFALWSIHVKWLHVEETAIADETTGALNRLGFDEVLDEEMRRAGRYHFSLALCFLDLDAFKSFNENFGRQLGTELLRRFTDFLRASVRYSDCVSRYENDEFAILLPHTDLIRAVKFLDRVQSLANDQFDATFCAGISAYRPGEDKAQFLARSLDALKQAKQEGHRKIRCIVEDDGSKSILSL